jgi:hypothetical protein
MLRCVKTDDIELKKLTYLYLMTYSSSEPEQAIMAVNTFVNDSQDQNPLVRALAVRTMCRIRLQNVAEHMVIPLNKCLADRDPYVRKTAAFGVSKLFDVIPEIIDGSGLLTDLLNLLQDENPMVVANTVAAITEINERRSSPIFSLDSVSVVPLLSATTACSEWCQTILYDGIARYVPATAEDATNLIDRFVPFLKHNNPAVVIGSLKCIFAWTPKSTKDSATLFAQIIPPFITLVSSTSPEIQYVVLRALSLFVQKYPRALAKEIRVFFCKYNDPSYVKIEKLDIIVTICSPQTAQLVLDELTEYANGVDVAFVRKTIQCIGQIAVVIEPAARRCVDILVQHVGGKANYAVEESVIVLTDILRKYPSNFESILQTVCQNFVQLKEPRAKSAGLWILGEYCDIIENVDVILDPFLDTFHDEEPQVQLQILSSLVKLYIAKPNETSDQLQFVLNEGTKGVNVPDVKNRALIYWRILSAGAQFAKDVVVFGKQTVMHSGVQFGESVLDELLNNMGSVAGVLHTVPADFVTRSTFATEGADDDDGEAAGAVRAWRQVSLNDGSNVDLFVDYEPGRLHFRIVNKTPSAIGQFAIAINKNAIGLAVVTTLQFPATLEFGDVAEVCCPVQCQGNLVANVDTAELQIALRTNLGTVFGVARIPVEFACLDTGKLSIDKFKDDSNAFPAGQSFQLDDIRLADDAELAYRNVFVAGKADGKVYASFQLPSKPFFLAELCQQGRDVLRFMKAQDPVYLPIVIASAQALFGHK